MINDYRPFTVELTEDQINAIKDHAEYNQLEPGQWIRRHLDDWLCLKPTYQTPSALVNNLELQLEQLLQLKAMMTSLEKLIDSHAKSYSRMKQSIKKVKK